MQKQKMEIVDQTTKIFQENFGQQPAHIASAPGRVNLLGEHVDYNDGFVLPAAIDRATYVAFSGTDSHQTTVRSRHERSLRIVHSTRLGPELLCLS